MKTKCNVKRVLAWYKSHNGNASATARHFKISRQTVHAYINKMKGKRQTKRRQS